MDVVAKLRAHDPKDALAISAEDGQIIERLISERNPLTLLEVGTGNGYSSLWICLAMSSAAQFVTIDSIDRRFDHSDKRMTKLFGTLEERFEQVPDELDFIFLDTDHQIHLIVRDIERLLPKMHPGTMVVVHDTAYCPEMGACLKDYFEGVESERLKTIPLKPSALTWTYRNYPTACGLATAILEEASRGDVQA